MTADQEIREEAARTLAYCRELEAENESLRERLGSKRSILPTLILLCVACLIGGGVVGYLASSMLTRSLPLQAGKAILSSLQANTASKGVVDKYLERQAALSGEADGYVSIIKGQESRILELEGELDSIKSDGDEARQVVVEAAERSDAAVEELTPEELEACRVPLAAKDFHIESLTKEREHLVFRVEATERLLRVEESQSRHWEQAYGAQKQRADLGEETVRKLRKRGFKVRPALFAGMARSPSRGQWGPQFGVGIALTYGR